MNKEEAIKYLLQLYPHGGHCWLDDERIEAIGMAIKALQEETVSIWHSIEELSTAREYEYILVIYKDTTAPRVAGNKTQVSYWDRVDKWAYLEDILNLSNVERTVKNWKEHVSPCENCEGDGLAGTCTSISELGRCPLKYRKECASGEIE